MIKSFENFEENIVDGSIINKIKYDSLESLIFEIARQVDGCDASVGS